MEFNNPSTFVTSGRIIFKDGNNNTTQIHTKIE